MKIRRMDNSATKAREKIWRARLSMGEGPCFELLWEASTGRGITSQVEAARDGR